MRKPVGGERRARGRTGPRRAVARRCGPDLATPTRHARLCKHLSVASIDSIVRAKVALSEAGAQKTVIYCVYSGVPGNMSIETQTKIPSSQTCDELGLMGFRFHDLRHTGNTLAASTGASTKELMSRMGHASPRAALIYQHATRQRDRALVDGLGRLMQGPRSGPTALRLIPGGRTESAMGVNSGLFGDLESSARGGVSPVQIGGDDGGGDGTMFEPFLGR